MALNDWLGEPVLGGAWLYGGTAPQRVLVVACNFDREHAMRLDEAEHIRATGGEPKDLGEPRPMGPDGVLYHLRGTSCPDFEAVEKSAGRSCSFSGNTVRVTSSRMIRTGCPPCRQPPSLVRYRARRNDLGGSDES